MPVSALTRGGVESVTSGSYTATTGATVGPPPPVLRPAERLLQAAPVVGGQPALGGDQKHPPAAHLAHEPADLAQGPGPETDLLAVAGMGPPHDWSLSTDFWTLPVPLLGRSATTSTRLG